MWFRRFLVVLLLVKPLVFEYRDQIVFSIIAAGYPAEVYSVDTQDGYQLRLHRIPCTTFFCKGPIVLAHGVIYSGLQYVAYPEESLAFRLAHEGYDIWIYNSRSTSYTIGHRSYDMQSQKYWDFSWHEFGYYDIPAVIDRVLEVTGVQKIHLVGHSQGATAVLVALSTQQKYSRHIASIYLMAPAVFLKFTVSLRVLQILVKVSQLLGIYAIRKNTGLEVCRSEWYDDKCYAVYMQVPLPEPYGNRINFIEEFFVSTKYLINNFSVKQMTHFLQVIKSGKFQHYDYGAANIFHYGTPQSPEYNLSSVEVPVVIRQFNDDMVVSSEGVFELTQHLPNVISYGTYPGSHAEFVFNFNVTELIKNDIIFSIALTENQTNFGYPLEDSTNCIR